jgi:hypothetical protein
MDPSLSASAEWTAGESNPDLRRAMPVSSRWTSSPIDETRSARESNSVSLPTKEVCCRNTCRPASWESSRQDSNLRYPVRETGVFAARRRDEIRASSTGGIRTHRHQALDLAAMPVSVPCHEHRQLRVGESNLRLRAYDTRSGTGPPASPRPRYRSGHAGLMRPGRAPARLERVQSPGGDSNSHASGARASEARASTSSATRRVVQWSVRESNPPLQLEGLMSFR